MSLRARLFAATLAALALTLALTIAIGAVLTRRQVDRSQAASVARLADELALQRRENVNYKTEDQLSGSTRILIQPRASFVKLVPNVNRSSDGEATYLGKRQLYSYRTLPNRGLILLRPASLTSAWRPFLVDLLLAGLVGVLFAAAVSFFVARSIVRPIRRVADATRALAADERHDPLPTEGSTELAALARAFNQMTEQLEASREAERNFLLSVSHELKTPLTAIRGYAEGLADGAFEPDEAARTIVLEAGRLERLVRDLLDLARMNRAEFSVRSEPVDLAETTREAVGRHEASAREFGVELRAAGAETWVEADRDRLLQVASNLVENALRETPAGGAVTVDRRAGPARRRGHRPGHTGRPTFPTPSSGSTSTTRSARTVPSAAGSGSRSSSSSRPRWAATSRSRAAPPGPRSRSRYGRSFEESTTSKSEPVRLPSACS